VLVVDDERVIADTLAIILNQNGFDASAVYTGTAAVDRARETKPDLIISDVIMPDMNGIEAAIRIRKVLPGCKILLFSKLHRRDNKGIRICPLFFSVFLRVLCG
jgi:CheY-like chemotaxis protein